MEQFTGSVTRLVFRNPETTYTVLRLAPDRPLRVKPPAASVGEASSAAGPQQATFIETDALPKLITVVGDFTNIEVGQQLWVAGEWIEHPAHGAQLRADRWKVELPTSLAGMQAYLASGMLRGIGPSLAAAIVAAFQEHTFDVIEHDPERLLQVPGIGPNRIQVIREVWHEQSAVRNLMAYLQAQNLPPTLAIKIYRALGPAAPQIVQSNPYQLTAIRGIGFKTADRIAANAGRPRDDAERLAAGLQYTLETFAEQGHTYMPQGLLVEAAASLLELPSPVIVGAVNQLTAAGERLVAESVPDSDDPAIYSASLHRLETETAQRLLALAGSPVSAIQPLRDQLSDDQIHWAASMAGQTNLSAEQRLAIRRAVEHKLSVITGGPGTGKTICLRSLVALLELYHFRCVLASPTGRAAKRLADATGHEAFTVHRLLQYTGDTFSEEEINADVLIVDEASMMDLLLARQLLAALRPTTHLVLVGDVEQLPAVGPGTVLADVIQSGLAQVTRLTHIFRQAQSSLIVTNAHRLNEGLLPLTPQRNCDFYLFATQNAAEAADWVVDITCHRIPAQFGDSLGLTDPLRDVQVLAPMYRGRAGVDRLNARLQALLNPPARQKAERALPRCTFRVGDKVMITRNDYEREVSNGDIGYVTGIDEDDQVLRLECDGRSLAYEWADTDDLVHAYAISIHKAQGSEYPAVVIPILTEHAVMLYRQLLYTAVTRARRLCVLVGSTRAIEMAIASNRGPNRYSALAGRLAPSQFAGR
jgi:exodeoxyribonuclease V alpha subunit